MDEDAKKQPKSNKLEDTPLTKQPRVDVLEEVKRLLGKK